MNLIQWTSTMALCATMGMMGVASAEDAPAKLETINSVTPVKSKEVECDHHKGVSEECDHKPCDHEHVDKKDHCDHPHGKPCEHKKGEPCDHHDKAKKHSDKTKKSDASQNGKTVTNKPSATKQDTALSAKDALALAGKNNCLSCHAIDKKVVGPAWKDVAAKYRGDAGAEAKLISKVSKGGSGNWGSIPMPANDPDGTKQSDIKALVKFVLSLK